MEIDLETLRAALLEKYPVLAARKPLGVAARHQLEVETGYPPEILAEFLFNHVRSKAYLHNLAKGRWRYHLNGKPAQKVSDAHRVVATRMLTGEIDRLERNVRVSGHPPDAQASLPHQPKILSALDMQTKTIKATFAVTDFEKHLSLDTVGAKEVPVVFHTPSGQVNALLNPKTFRKAQATFKEHSGACNVVVSGELDLTSRTLKSAGITVMPTPKKEAQTSTAAPPAPPEQSPHPEPLPPSEATPADPLPNSAPGKKTLTLKRKTVAPDA